VLLLILNFTQPRSRGKLIVAMGDDEDGCLQNVFGQKSW
jgi:hypothetical protein